MNETDNPFYSNHVFKDIDLKRIVIKKWQYPLLWLLPTYVQISDGYAFHYKRWNGHYYLMKTEPLPVRNEHQRVTNKPRSDVSE